MNAFEKVDRLLDSSRKTYEQIATSGHARYLKRLDEQMTSFERATANLDRHQLSRVNAVLAGFDPPDDQARPPRTLWALFLNLFTTRRRVDPFEEYLRRAHEHPAVARKAGGVRSWFASWRSCALEMLAAGLSSVGLEAIVRATSPPPAARRIAGSPSPDPVIQHSFRERLLHVIEPHGPTAGLQRRDLTWETGLAA
jgi:hypothetical protein